MMCVEYCVYIAGNFLPDFHFAIGEFLRFAGTIFVALKMISSLYCAVSEPNVYKHYKRLT